MKLSQRLNKKIKLPKVVPDLSPTVLADILFRRDKRVDAFLGLPEEKRLQSLYALTARVRKDIIQRLPDQDVAKMIQQDDPDGATDLLQLMSKSKRERVLRLVSKDLKQSLSTLLEFDPETAAGLMTLDYVQLNEGDSIADAAAKFRTHEQRTGRAPVMLVVNAEGKLGGYLPGHELGFAAKSETIKKYVKRIATISYAATHSEVIRQFQARPHSKVVVLNDKDEVIGIIYSDDVLQIIQNQQASSLYDFAGISDEESVTDTAKQKVANRYRWLIINLGTAFLAAYTVGLFEKTLEQFVLLAVYMPIVAGMGGNAATQTLAVQVRGISLGQIELRTALRALKSELGAAFINGAINAVLVALVVIIFNRDLKIAIVLALAMIVNLLVAGFFGTLVPLIMAKLGKDPAASATIFITTATDVLGFLVFLGLGTVILA